MAGVACRRRFADVAGKPGEITAIGAESIFVTVQGGSLELLKVRIEGGEKSSAAAFCTALGLVVGSRLSVPAATSPVPNKEPARHAARPAKDAEPATA